jgi:hypothetical protein
MKIQTSRFRKALVKEATGRENVNAISGSRQKFDKLFAENL